jgi:hypothetical protein
MIDDIRSNFRACLLCGGVDLFTLSTFLPPIYIRKAILKPNHPPVWCRRQFSPDRMEYKSNESQRTCQPEIDIYFHIELQYSQPVSMTIPSSMSYSSPMQPSHLDISLEQEGGMQAMYMDSLMTAMQVSLEPIVHCLN